MKELFIYILISGCLLIGFLITLVLGIFKKNKRWLLSSLIGFILFVMVAGYTGYLFISKSYAKLTEITKPRSGAEIYAALFGKSPYNCITVLHHQDQVIPKVDYAIWLEVQTCPDEMKRILSAKEFSRKKITSKELHVQQPSANDLWFKPETLGDSLYVFEKLDVYGNGQIFYCKEDSTKIYCMDILD